MIRALAGVVLSVLVFTSAATAQSTRCSSSDVRRLQSAFYTEMNNRASQVVWLGSSKSAELSGCSRTSDGFIVTGRFHLFGTDDAYYWLDGRMVTNSRYGPRTIEVTNANGNFIGLTIIKGVTIIGGAAAACSASGEC